MIYINILFDLLKIILIWPVVVLVIFLMFKNSISKFIDEVSQVVWGKTQVTRINNQSSNEEVGRIFKKQNNDGNTWDYKKLYLDLFLKPNTLNALKWFYENKGKFSASDFFLGFFLVQPTGRDENEEKVAILSALKENNLIEITMNKYSITSEGEDYLKERKLI